MIQKPNPYCVGCDYLSRLGTCDFILITGISRPSAYGDGCTEYRKDGERVRRIEWDTARAEALKAEGKSYLEIAEMVGASRAAIVSYFQRRKPASQPRKREESPSEAAQRAATKAPEPAPAETVTPEPPAPVADVAMNVMDLAALLSAAATVCPDAQLHLGGVPVLSLRVSVSQAGPKAAPTVELEVNQS